MKTYRLSLLIFLGVFFSFSAYSQVENHYVRAGNKNYSLRHIDKAEKDYRSALTQNPSSFYGNFNLGDALYQKKDWLTARNYFQKAVDLADTPEKKADAYHNIGCTYLQESKYAESVDALQKSMIQNPNSEKTRDLLSYAQRMLKKNQKNPPRQANSGDKKKETDMSMENAKLILKNLDEEHQRKPVGEKKLIKNW